MTGWTLVLDEQGRVQTGSARAADRSSAPALFSWFHFHGRREDALAWLQAHTRLPETVLSALTATETRPRSEHIGPGALVNLRGLKEEAANGEAELDFNGGDPLVSIRLWADQGRAISVSFRKLGGLEELRERMEASRIRDPGDLIANLAMIITARFDPVVADLGDLIDECEVSLDPGHAFEMRRLITRARSRAIAYRRFVAPQRQALERMAEFNLDWLEEGDRLHLREAADRFARMAEELEAVRERSALLHEQLTDLRAEQTETRTLLIAIVALVFLPLTFLTGLLGMNVEGIPFAHARWAFWGVVILCAGIALAISAYFIRSHWVKH
ncbi:zinc transporter ZntB [Sphingomonas oleivorans]|uniref:Zinc transporter ZntB n=1 Tax=Sphingomonas oleivorans TaxID=1735121 RepID=A0A2T5FU51_9SPHN|nr:zinc transporter ZntB [Sphingomonas oleivorans]PTQ07806.1 zinc transporter ZntB [Sphingomonas oleivorans]